MIFLPLLYVGDFVRWGGIDDGSFGESGLRTWVALFLICQTGFTWAAHRRALPAYKKSDLLMWIGAVAAVAVVTFLLKRPASFNTLYANGPARGADLSDFYVFLRIGLPGIRLDLHDADQRAIAGGQPAGADRLGCGSCDRSADVLDGVPARRKWRGWRRPLSWFWACEDWFLSAIPGTIGRDRRPRIRYTVS
jgi:hypothetical protein